MPNYKIEFELLNQIAKINLKEGWLKDIYCTQPKLSLNYLKKVCPGFAQELFKDLNSNTVVWKELGDYSGFKTLTIPSEWHIFKREYYHRNDSSGYIQEYMMSKDKNHGLYRRFQQDWVTVGFYKDG